MNKKTLTQAFIGSLALSVAGCIAGCSPPQAQSSTVAAAPAPAPKVGHEVCSDEVITHTREPKDKDQIAGTVAGAVIGGVLGHQVDKGDGKKVATVAGAAAGGYAGNKIQENAQEKNTYEETKRTCRMVYD